MVSVFASYFRSHLLHLLGRFERGLASNLFNFSSFSFSSGVDLFHWSQTSRSASPPKPQNAAFPAYLTKIRARVPSKNIVVS